MKITREHYYFYTQHKIKTIANYKPLDIVSIHTLIPHERIDTNLHNLIALLKMVRKRQSLISYLRSIVKVNSKDKRYALALKWLKRVTKETMV